MSSLFFTLVFSASKVSSTALTATMGNVAAVIFVYFCRQGFIYFVHLTLAGSLYGEYLINGLFIMVTGDCFFELTTFHHHNLVGVREVFVIVSDHNDYLVARLEFRKNLGIKNVFEARILVSRPFIKNADFTVF